MFVTFYFKKYIESGRELKFLIFCQNFSIQVTYMCFKKKLNMKLKIKIRKIVIKKQQKSIKFLQKQTTIITTRKKSLVKKYPESRLGTSKNKMKDLEKCPIVRILTIVFFL